MESNKTILSVQIGKRIAALREREGISQANLARQLDVTRAAVNAWEMGLSSPNAKSLVDLSGYFHVSVDYLIGISEDETVSLLKLSREDKKIVIDLVHRFEKE